MFAKAQSQAPSRPTADSVVTLRLANGTQLVGKIVEEGKGRVRLSVPGAGDVTIDSAAVISRSAGTPPAPASAPAVPAAAPKPPRWSGAVTLSGTYVSGLIPKVSGTTLGAQASAEVAETQPSGGLSFNASLGYQRTEPAVAAMNQWALKLGWRHELSSKVSFIFSSKFDVNHAQHVSGRSGTQAGVGFFAAHTPKVTLLLAPGVGYSWSQQDAQGKILSFASGAPSGQSGFAGGIFDLFIVTLAPGLTFDQQFLMFHTIGRNTSSTYQFDARLTGMVTRTLGISAAFVQQFDSSIPHPVNRTMSSLNSGLQIRF